MNEVAKIDSNKIATLIKHAAAALEKATSWAEILDVSIQAQNAHNAARAAARIAKVAKAHSEVTNACHRAMADSIEIQIRARCRLADEYDAAQDKGEIAKRTDFRGNKWIVPKNTLVTASELGVAGPEIFFARQLRDAEKAEPGIVRRLLDEQLEKGKPVFRRLLDSIMERRGRKARRRQTPVLDRAREIVRPTVEAGGKVNARKLGEEHGISHVQVEAAVAAERARKETLDAEQTITPDMLGSMTAREKYEAAVRQARRQIEATFEQRVQQRVQEGVAVVLEHYQKDLNEAKGIQEYYHQFPKKMPLTRDEYRKLLACLHPDQSMSEKARTEMFNRVKELELRLTPPSPEAVARPVVQLPRTPEELAALKAKVAAERKAKRAL